ncbi:MAG: endonuclease III [Dehalococcoidia bacterium]|nr:endonuclease III [Dehalococcoidia bacterium]
MTTKRKHSPADPHRVLADLRILYGHQKWTQRRKPLDELIYTVLSQHTSDANTDRTFASLKSRFPAWRTVQNASPEEVAEAIKLGGLSRVKAPRIRAILDAIEADRGDLDLGFLERIPMTEARGWLTALPGVGPKTAACVLLFSFGLPAMPVDTHVHRVSKRLGFIAEKLSADKAHPIIESLVDPNDVYQFHINLIEHGRKVCHARRAACATCILNEICPSSTTNAASPAVSPANRPLTDAPKKRSI